MMSFVLTSAMALTSAAGNKAIPLGAATMDPIGEHQRLLLFEKNENPQNVMVVYTKINGGCSLAKGDNGLPVFDFYWLMDGVKYKPVHPLIKAGIRDRLEFQAGSAGTGTQDFYVRINDLKEVKNDLPDPRLHVELQSEGTTCAVDARIQLGPSDQGRVLKVESIYSEAKKTFLPPFRKLIAVTLRGVDAKTGENVERRYQGK